MFHTGSTESNNVFPDLPAAFPHREYGFYLRFEALNALPRK
jgi:hypothetical protein